MAHVEFQGIKGSTVALDGNGDAIEPYSLMNYVLQEDGEMHGVEVGTFAGQLQLSEGWYEATDKVEGVATGKYEGQTFLWIDPSSCIKEGQDMPKMSEGTACCSGLAEAKVAANRVVCEATGRYGDQYRLQEYQGGYKYCSRSVDDRALPLRQGAARS